MPDEPDTSDIPETPASFFEMARLELPAYVPLTLQERVAVNLYCHENRDEGMTLHQAAKMLTSDDAKGAHSGDCTHECHTCMRCERDRMMETAKVAIRTIRSEETVEDLHQILSEHGRRMIDWIWGDEE